MTNNNQSVAFVHWREGAEMLGGINRNAFFYLVESGQVAQEEGRKPRDGRYSVKDILRVKEKREQGKPRKAYRKRPQPVTLDWLSPLDIPAILRLDQIVYDEMFLAEAATYRQWSEKNPQLAMAAFDARYNREIMLAYVAALPLDERIILEVMRHEREEIDITQEEIQTYERPGAYTLLANSAVTHPDRPDLLYKILYRMMDEWIARFPERYVTRVYAQAVSERGDKMIQHFFMAPRYDLASDAYMLDLARPGASRVIRHFQEQLTHKAPLPLDLQQPYQPTMGVPQKPITFLKEQYTESIPGEALPPGYVPIYDLIKQYGLVRQRNSIIRSMKPWIKTGHWNVAGHEVKNALDAEGQVEFARRYQRLR